DEHGRLGRRESEVDLVARFVVARADHNRAVARAWCVAVGARADSRVRGVRGLGATPVGRLALQRAVLTAAHEQQRTRPETGHPDETAQPNAHGTSVAVMLVAGRRQTGQRGASTGPTAHLLLAMRRQLVSGP